jgi:glycosyltransferase involved in cell wall biosynthesis
MTALKTAIIHDWFATAGGGELVVRELTDVAPNSEIFTIYNLMGGKITEYIGGRPLHISGLNRLPFVDRYYNKILPLACRAAEAFDLSAFNLVLSSSAAIAKAVITRPDQLHISYVHSPARYAWDLREEYLRESNIHSGVKLAIARELMFRFRQWDVTTATRPDVLVANSEFIRRRIRKYYRRDAEVIYPPVNIDAFARPRRGDDFYITTGRLVAYKRVDIALAAFAGMRDRKFVVVGEGPELQHLKKLATPNVEFVGRIDDVALADYYSRARAFIFCALEDFGIAPVEAQAAGVPVIAFGKGGALETVRGLDVDQPTGVLFAEQTTTALRAAITTFEKHTAIDFATNAAVNARRFDRKVFHDRLSALIDTCWRRYGHD